MKMLLSSIILSLTYLYTTTRTTLFIMVEVLEHIPTRYYFYKHDKHYYSLHMYTYTFMMKIIRIVYTVSVVCITHTIHYMVGKTSSYFTYSSIHINDSISLVFFLRKMYG